ncbi:MAG: hypothetical protein CMJ60_11710 [Planctomycetaceae bacterium]|jgi:hypothetical protein|nr:hypothetical protein [Planctomycetaceae bacterium]MDB4864335.1 DUF2203 domain-containing protein [Pirellulaceae bacterium]|tara:strand:- start:99 stop:560 length:462 start_codon:yes stop_codon:yes gene_type:complete
MSPNQTLKLFTIEQANASLPLVRAITSDLAELSSVVFERQRHLATISSGRELGEATDPYAEEVVHEQAELERQTARLHELIDELRALGAEPKNGPGGRIDLVDFPAEKDGRVIYLCWRLGEASVEHWHEIDAGFNGRRSVTDLVVEQVAEGSA